MYIILNKIVFEEPHKTKEACVSPVEPAAQTEHARDSNEWRTIGNRWTDVSQYGRQAVGWLEFHQAWAALDVTVAKRHK